MTEHPNTQSGRSRPRVALAMSGGVDSTVAARVLQESGWEVLGLTLSLYDAPAGSGHSTEEAAAEAAASLRIFHEVVDLKERFEATVVEEFCREYGMGRTPNPCVLCNAGIKLRVLLEWSREHDCGAIATGHYVRLEGRGTDGPPLLRQAVEENKDQSYVLWMLSADILERVVFPMGEMRKEDVRTKARDLGLPGWDREESQDICFVTSGSYADLVSRRLGEGHSLLHPGPITDEEGRNLGMHKGLVHYTVGQRRGLGLSGPEVQYVQSLEPQTNTLRIGPRSGLLRSVLVADRPRLHVSPELLAAEPVDLKIRYRSPAARGWARLENEQLVVRFQEPQWAVAPGQSVVAYRDGRLLAGGRILDARTGDSDPRGGPDR